MATYFSNKELHSSTPQLQEQGTHWGRMKRADALQLGFFNDKSEFAQLWIDNGALFRYY